MAEEGKPQTLAPPAVTALRGEAAGSTPLRIQMERTASQDIRDEREDLKEAAEHSLNVIMDLDLDGKIRYVSDSWKDVIGTTPEEVVGTPVADILLGDSSQFAETVESIKKDDSRSQITRFAVRMGPLSVLRRKRSKHSQSGDSPTSPVSTEGDEDQIINLEAQGIMVYDRTTGTESHTMWMIRPSVIREVTIDLPEVLVESLGVGAEMLAQYLTALAEQGAKDPGSHPPPLPVLCRICERQITPWWFEKHTELCLQEHRAEMDVQLAQESLSEHRNAIVKVLDALEAQSRQSRATSADAAPSPPPTPEYKGIQIQSGSTPSSGTPSGRNSPASPPSKSRERSTGFGHHRARSFAVRRPLARMVELVLDLCDTAIEINTPAIKDNTRTQSASEIRTQSPQSENRISQVLQWQSPSSGSVEHGDGFRLLCEDTNKFARAKVDAVFRHRRILEYSERIRVEFDVLVQECIEAAMVKAAQIAAGEDSSSDDDHHQEELEDQADMDETPGVEEGMFPGSFDGPSAMAQALRNASDPSLPARVSRRESSVAGSTRSSSPRGGCQTPRSHAGAISIATQNKRHSMHFESDAGADSDSSVRSSVMSGPRRSDSPSSELGLSRVASSRERKRKSLILPSVMSSRQHSPARSMVPPSSPLRMSKPRLPGGVPNGIEGLQSPITSPVMPTSEFSSPAMAHINHHRRQSSTAGSDPKPISPRLIPVSAPQPRAVPPSIKDFEIIKPISKGAFGSVYLAKKKSTGEYFAIKVLKKADMVAKNQVTNVKAERAIMMWQGESDFVAKLYWTFSSKDFLYLVMEYLNGGDCASLIKVLGALPEDWAKKYLAEVVLGVEHLHSRGIVHRDLKPDNLLIDQKGHLKLTDFGLSRMGLIGRQKRALNSKSDDQAPDLLKSGPFHRATSIGSSRSASFDLNPSPSQTPSMTPAVAGDLAQPSYFSLSREASQSRDPSRRVSGNRSESGDSEALQAMFRRFSIVDDQLLPPRKGSPIEEETYSDEGSPDLFPIAPSMSQSIIAHNSTPPPSSTMPPPPMALFDPQDGNRRFVGTPDYLAPETISGSGQDEVSDWWSLGCILFECLYGYPPFHAETPDQVFENILARRIDWPEEDSEEISAEAKDLMNRLLSIDPVQRLGANSEDKFASGGEEIRSHPWFADLNWDSLRDDEASFIPAPENPEDTEYFDSRGAAMQSFAPEFEDQGTSSAGTPNADYPDRPHDALSRVRSQISVTTMKRGLIPLHIPAHVREGRSRRLSEPVATDDFGNFSYKNLPVLEKANKDVIQKLRAEAMHAQNKSPSALISPTITSPSPSLESSPMLPAPLKRTLSTKGSGRPASPSISGLNSSPSRGSQPSSPLLVQFSTGQHHDRRKTSSSSSTLSQATSNPASLQLPGNFFESGPRLQAGFSPTPDAISPIKLVKTPTAMSGSLTEKGAPSQRQPSLGQTSVPSPRARSQTMGSQDGDVVRDLMPSHHKRRSQVFDVSPSSSDTEDSRAKALLRVQRRRQSSRRLSQISVADGPIFRPLDVLVCEDHPVSRLVMEKLLEKLRCRTLTVTNGAEAVRYAMGEVKFDIIMMEYKLPQVNGADVARMIRDTKNANSNTPIVAVTGYLKELQAPHHFDALIEKPPTVAKLTDILGKLCQWKAPPANWTPGHSMYPSMMPSGLRQESTRQEDSPTSNSSGFPPMPSGSYRGSSREDSISSSFFGDNDSRTDDVPVIIARHSVDDWRERDLARVMSGLGISEEPTGHVDPKGVGNLPVPRDLPPHGASAPAVLENATIRKQRSAELVGAKRRILETRRHESAESGDDEDDELGNINMRARSPKTRPKSSSKLGIEMMRTNSRGSVISVDDIGPPDSSLASSPPPAITEERGAEEHAEHVATSDVPPASLTPPEIFPLVPGAEVQEIEMETPKASVTQEVVTPKADVEQQEADIVTPKASAREGLVDPDPTPKAHVSSGP